MEKERLLAHFAQLFSSQNSIPEVIQVCEGPWDEPTEIARDWLSREISIAEVVGAIRRSPRGKAAGKDGIRNEHLRQTLDLAPCWTALFERCWREGQIPEIWREATLIVIPKGKGRPDEPGSWRGIAIKSCPYKIFSGIIARRLTEFLEERQALPDEQHGFRRNRSTYTAIADLLDRLKEVLRHPKRPLYAVFVDLKAAFDKAPRDKILEKLSKDGVPRQVLNVLGSILKENRLWIDNGVEVVGEVTQTTGVAQGDGLSPLLFSVLLGELPRVIKGDWSRDWVKTLLYADDIVVYGESLFRLEQAVSRIVGYMTEMGLEINWDKTVAMKFRRGGRLARGDILRVRGKQIAFVNKFTYLGLSLSVTGFNFTGHVMERVNKAKRAAAAIKNPQLISMKTAEALFKLKIAPIATYGLQLIWEHLGERCLSLLDGVKFFFLKRVLGVSNICRNRLVRVLEGGPLLVEDLQIRFNLPKTRAFERYTELWKAKMREIDSNIFVTKALRDGSWREAGNRSRHLTTTFAVHGYHHSLCQREGFHEPDENCRCLRCWSVCDRYHAGECPAVRSVAELAK